MSEITAYALALFTAFCWALAPLFAFDATRNMGASSFVRFRLMVISLPLSIFAVLFGDLSSISLENYLWILISSIIGISIGDAFLFACVNRIGPRRSTAIFASHAPITVLLAWFLLQEIISYEKLIGCIIAFVGIVLAILNQKKKPGQHRWESNSGSIAIGILFGLLAATGQAIGVLIIKPVLESGAEPIAVSLFRIVFGLFALNVYLFIKNPNILKDNKANGKDYIMTSISALLAMGIGMTTLIMALKYGESGIIATLSSFPPVMILPFIWYATKKVPHPLMWIGAILAVVGSGLIFGMPWQNLIN